MTEALPTPLRNMARRDERSVVFTFDPDAAWRSRPSRDRLRVPIGVGDGASPVHLDIKESAQQGMGPHGLVIGATGSGKSEFLRTLARDGQRLAVRAAATARATGVSLGRRQVTSAP